MTRPASKAFLRALEKARREPKPSRQCTGGIGRAMCWHPDGQGHLGGHEYAIPDGPSPWKAATPPTEPKR